MADDESAWLDRSLIRPHLSLVGGETASATEPLDIREAEWPDAADIPPRPWLYGTWLQRGQVTVLVADSGVGKTVLMMTVAMEIASGRAVLGHKVWYGAPIWYFCLEDPRAEAWRRMEAIRQHHKFSRQELLGKFHLHVGRERRLNMACIGDDGSSVVFPDRSRVVECAADRGIGLMVVDPAIASYRGVRESSNEEMEEVVTAWAEIADEVGCAVLLGHHTRKAATGTVDDGRGAGSIKGAARVALRMLPMDPTEAERFGVPLDERGDYIRVDDGKMNMAAKSTRAWWGRMDRIGIGNPTAEYPAGDHVAALSRWDPPGQWDGIDSALANAILDRIEAGLPNGSRYSSGNRAGERAAWRAVSDQVPDRTEAQSRAIVAAWLKSGLLYPEEYHDPVRRAPLQGLRVAAAKRPS